jgi:CMP-N,N'-diacetyllegionaminic acid synthase
MRFLGLIPARGGSKGIPRKNIKPMAGKPLIAWSIEAAQASKRLDRFVVSTEDAEIAKVARKYGAEVLDRPKKLAGDTASGLSVIQHALDMIQADAIVLLQPTSPVRRPGLIDECIVRYEKSGCDNLGTGYMCSLFEYGSYTQRRQDLKPFFHDDGNVYVFSAKLIRQGKLFGKKVERFEVPRDHTFEIDDEFDFWLNEKVLEERR